MAGGGGTRFWPLSTKAEPKQFLNLSGKDILVNETIDRQHDLMDQKDIFIVTNETQAKMMKGAHSRQNCGRSYSGRSLRRAIQQRVSVMRRWKFCINTVTA